MSVHPLFGLVIEEHTLTIFGAYADGDEHTAQVLRLAIMALLNTNVGALGCDGGVRMNALALTALKATPGVSGLTVSVAPGLCVIPGTDGVAQGPYVMASDDDVTVTLDAASGSQGRYDRIVAQVVDSGTGATYQITKVTGTPAASPSLPALPASSLALAAVLVPALANGPEDLTVTDARRQLGALGRVYVNVPMVEAVGYSIPTHTTTSATFQDMFVGTQLVQYPTVACRLLVHSDGGTTGEVKVTINDVQLGNTLSIAAGSYQAYTVSGTIPQYPTTIDLGDEVQIEVSARRTAGTGSVKVRPLYVQMRPLT